MDSFEQFRQAWQQQSVPIVKYDVAQLKRSNAANQRKLERPQLISAILLLLTTGFIIGMGYFSTIRFKSALTYVAVDLLALIPAIQGIINLSVYARLRRINVTAPVTEHLLQWERYYTFRKRMIRVNIPLYYLLLSGAFGLYFIEILGYFSWTGRVVAVSLYLAWMLYTYFVLGKRSLRKESERLESIMNNLKRIRQQLGDDSGLTP